MKNLKTLLCLIVAIVMMSCNSHTTNLTERVNKFADLECRAMRLREKRFELANQLRFTQDTLLATKNKADTVRLKARLTEFNKEKESVLKQSLTLADSIHIELNDLMKTQLTNKADKDNFDQMLNKALADHGCIEKP